MTEQHNRTENLPAENLGAVEEAAQQALAAQASTPDSGGRGERIRGPVVLRGEHSRSTSTTDQRLLDSRGPSDWVHTDPWRTQRCICCLLLPDTSTHRLASGRAVKSA